MSSSSTRSLSHLIQVQDPRYLPEPLSQKDARHLQETTGRLEDEYRALISEVVPAGSNLILLCAQVLLHILLVLICLSAGCTVQYRTVPPPAYSPTSYCQVAARIELEQGRAVWVPSGAAVW